MANLDLALKIVNHKGSSSWSKRAAFMKESEYNQAAKLIGYPEVSLVKGEAAFVQSTIDARKNKNGSLPKSVTVSGQGFFKVKKAVNQKLIANSSLPAYVVTDEDYSNLKSEKTQYISEYKVKDWE